MFYHFTYQVFFCYCCHCLLFVYLFIYMLDYKWFLVEILKSVIFILKSFPPAPYTQLNWQGLYTKPCLPIWGTAKISSQLFNLLVIVLYFQFRSYPRIWAQFICRLFGFLHCGTLFLECPSQFFSLPASDSGFWHLKLLRWCCLQSPQRKSQIHVHLFQKSTFLSWVISFPIFWFWWFFCTFK